MRCCVAAGDVQKLTGQQGGAAASAASALTLQSLARTAAQQAVALYKSRQQQQSATGQPAAGAPAGESLQSLVLAEVEKLLKTLNLSGTDAETVKREAVKQADAMSADATTAPTPAQ